MNQNQVPSKPVEVETKTTPFSLPKAATEDLDRKQIRKLKYIPRPQNDSFSIFIIILIAILVVGVGYLGYTLARLQSTTNTTKGNIIDITVPVAESDAVEVTDDADNDWSRKELK